MSTATEWQKSLPMWITTSRMLMVVPILFLMQLTAYKFDLFAAALFIIASISDYYDGYYARKYNSVSTLGKFMDPVADKVLVSSVLVMLLVSNKVDPYLVILLISRDTFIGAIRAVAAADNLIIAAKPAGKWKTGLQMVAIPTIMIGDPIFKLPLDKIGYGALWISALLSLTSGFEYYMAYKKSQPAKTQDVAQ